ncbi:Ig-like domain-containing protein [Marinoscillum furvescens]|uniref:Putative secreted protein (Por secretion system target) n=1 Tax=Marinoscillum furvescens DSM 4134 TaxID=1122208 RepID=A0A3D9L778_MARFU|nr:Ig-like domain-containing protein [Marinoscillum furvescens]REE01150.1 putative secreted protein (Por secretion system target) [Marinoscillum furvescens DSM 4134]
MSSGYSECLKSVLVLACCMLHFSAVFAQMQAGDPGVVPDYAVINANKTAFPQMERWAKAGVRGGIPFPETFDVVRSMEPGTSSDINNKIKEVSGLLKEGELGLVVLRNGEYDIREEVTMRSNVSLIGESRSGTVCTIDFKNGFGFHFSGVHRSGIYRMTIQGGWGTPRYDWNYSLSENDEMPDNENVAVKFKGSVDCWLDEVNIYNSGKDPMRCAAAHTTFRNLKVKGAHRKAGGAQGYFFIQGPDNLITGCEMTHLRHISLQGAEVEYNVVYDNNFHQEVSFHSGDNGNNLIEGNRITLPADMPPVEAGGPYPEVNTNAPNYFAIMGPWSSQHEVSHHPNYLFANQCLQLNHNFGSNTPWSDPSVVYSGPVRIGKTPEDHISNFPVLSEVPPKGNTLYAVSGANPTVISHLARSPRLQFIKPITSQLLYGSPVLIQLQAYDEYLINEVHLYLDSQLVGVKSHPPYVWNNEGALATLDLGQHELVAVAEDDEGLKTTRVLNIEVVDPVVLPDSYTETFTNMELSGWGESSFVGDDGWVWSVNAKGVNGDLDGKGVYFQKQQTGIRSGTLLGGLKDLSFECINKFDDSERIIEVYVNEQLVHSHRQSGYDKYQVKVSDLQIMGEFVIEIRNASVDEGDVAKTVSFDNISWTTLGQQLDAPPVLTFKNLYDSFNFREGESVEVHATAIDDKKIDSVELYIDDKWVATATHPPYEWGEELSALRLLSSGAHDIKITAYDNSQQQSSHQVRILRNANDAPLISVTEPVSGSRLYELTGLGAYISDDGDLKSVSLYLNDQLLDYQQEEPFGWEHADTISALIGLQGAQILKIVAEDTEGATSQRIIHVLMNDAPNISITNPTSSTYQLGEEIPLEIVISDDFGEMEKATLYLNGETLDTKSDSPFSWSHDTSFPALHAMSIGAHTLKVQAIDQSGLLAEDSVIFSVIQALGSQSKQERALIYPNPTNQKVLVLTEVPHTVAVYDVAGTLVYQSVHKARESQIDLSGVSAGSYLLKVNEPTQVKSYLLIRK